MAGVGDDHVDVQQNSGLSDRSGGDAQGSQNGGSAKRGKDVCGHCDTKCTARGKDSDGVFL